MDFKTFKLQSIQLAQVMLAQQDEATKAEFINALVEQINDAKVNTDEELEAAWPTWSKGIVAACNGDEAGMTECYEEAEAVAAAKPQAPAKTTIYPQTLQEPVETQGRNWLLMGGAMAAGAALAIFGGPAGMAAGYGVAKAGEMGSRNQYTERNA